MKTNKHIVIVLVLGLLVAASGQASEKAAKRLSETLSASCLVRISSDPAILPLDLAPLDALLHSSGVGGKAAREVLGISPDEVQDSDMILIEAISSSDSMISSAATAKPEPTPRRPGESTAQYEARRRAEAAARARAIAVARSSKSTKPSFVAEESILVYLQVNLEDEMKPAAEEFMSALIDNLRSSLLHTFDDHRRRLDDYLKTAEQETARTEQDLRDKQEVLRRISGTQFFDRDQIIHNMMELRNKIERIEMEQLSEKVIIDATAERIAEIEAKTKAQLEGDDITKELLKMLDLQMRHLSNTKTLVDAGQAGQSHLADAEEKLARARIELAQRREQLSKSAGGNLIETLNAQLADSSIKAAQDKAYLASYKEQLAEAEVMLKGADEYELLSLETDIARENLREVLVWRDQISRRLRMLQPPALSVLGGE